MKKLALIAAALAGTFAASTAAAQPVQLSDDGSYRITISYADLNLASPAGMRTLQTRIKGAASQVCGVPGARSLVEIRSSAACRSGIMNAALARVEIASASRRIEVAGMATGR